MGSVIPAASRMAPELMNLLVMTGAFLMVAAGGLIWLFFFRKTRSRRRKYRHAHHSRPSEITLSQNGGPLSIRQERPSSGPPPPAP